MNTRAVMGPDCNTDKYLIENSLDFAIKTSIP